MVDGPVSMKSGTGFRRVAIACRRTAVALIVWTVGGYFFVATLFWSGTGLPYAIREARLAATGRDRAMIALEAGWYLVSIILSAGGFVLLRRHLRATQSLTHRVVSAVAAAPAGLILFSVSFVMTPGSSSW